MVTTELDELQHLVAGLRGCTASILTTYGDCPAIRRVLNDADSIRNGVDRLEIDIEDFDLAGGHAQVSPALVQIPETQYDHAFWRDVDHEGIGGRRS
jgi:hypothetical protein